MPLQNYYLMITDYKCKKWIVQITFESVLIYLHFPRVCLESNFIRFEVNQTHPDTEW